MSQSTQQQPQQQTQDLIIFEGFLGLNTQPSRYGLDPKQCAILDGFFPAGESNARVIPDNGPAVFVQTGPGITIPYFSFGNIGATPYCLIFNSDGSIGVINTDTDAIGGLANPGTILNPVPGNVGVSQLGSKYILIVTGQQSNGYFIWDGTTFYSAGDIIAGIDGPGPIASSSLHAGGSGYATGDTGTVTGGINDATYAVTSVNTTSHGTGYAANDTGVVTTGDGNATYLVNTVDGLGGVTGMHITAPGTNYLTANNVATATGGGQPGIGVGLTLNITVNSPPGPITGFTLTSTGVVTGYTLTADGTLYDPTIGATTATGGAQPGVGTGFTLDITVTSATMPSGISGTAIETYQSYVFVANGPNLFWTGPGSFTDFSTANGGGSLTANNSSLRVRYTQLKQSNGYLFLFGDSSTGYISGIQTTGSPPTTSFSLQNVDPEVGTPWPDTVDLLGSSMVFANAWGAHVSYGGRSTKASPELDGIYNTVPGFAGLIPSAGKAILFGKRIWVLLLPVIDQYTGQQINKLFLWDEKRWCSTQQSASLVFVQHQEIDSVLTVWGTDGLSMYRLFQRPTANLQKVIRSKFWAPLLSYADLKAEGRLWGVVQFFSGGATTVTISIDSENGPSPTVIPIAPPSVVWENDTDAIVSWFNSAAVVVLWSSGRDGTVVLPVTACGQQGALVGITLTTNAQDLAILSLATQPVHVQFRG